MLAFCDPMDCPLRLPLGKDTGGHSFLPDPRIKLVSPAMVSNFFTTKPPEKPQDHMTRTTSGYTSQRNESRVPIYDSAQLQAPSTLFPTAKLETTQCPLTDNEQGNVVLR